MHNWDDSMYDQHAESLITQCFGEPCPAVGIQLHQSMTDNSICFLVKAGFDNLPRTFPFKVATTYGGGLDEKQLAVVQNLVAALKAAYERGQQSERRQSALEADFLEKLRDWVDRQAWDRTCNLYRAAVRLLGLSVALPD